MDTQQFLLHNKISKKSKSIGRFLPISLRGSEKLLPCEPMIDTISEMEVYNAEREACNTLRVSFSVNTIASNVCFNNITEIVKYEGSDNAICLNTATKSDFSSALNAVSETIQCKLPTHFVSVTDCVRDTQLSSTENGFTYHCGLDIMNNHILRSLTFRAINPNSTKDKDFNTLNDLMRHFIYEDNATSREYKQVKGYLDGVGSVQQKPKLKLHTYNYENVLSFADSVATNLEDKNGWLGFKNKGKFPTYLNGSKVQLDINNVINSKKSCDFVEMYPQSDLFYFTPKYNSYRHRIEKNWNYCLTYPSSSTTDNITFINSELNSLKVMLFDDTVTNSDSTPGIVFWSISKHGLKKGDYVNIYTGNTEDSCAIHSAKVTRIVDDYTFYIYRGSTLLSSAWHTLTQEETKTAPNEEFKNEWNIGYEYDDETGDYVMEGNKPKIITKKFKFTDATKDKVSDEDNNVYYILNKTKVNVDITAQNISFKRVTGNQVCKYYVRIFSRIPNWRFVDRTPSVHELYKPKENENDKSLIERYQTIENEFENHIGQIAFAKNIYNDDVAGVTFTDDINIANLKDNLGRPLSEIFITLIKNNKGYREWYGKNRKSIQTSNENVEFSHCFGKVNCAFKLSDVSAVNIDHKNSVKLTNLLSDYNTNGLDMTDINPRPTAVQTILDEDEIEYNQLKDNIGNIIYDGDVHFYGDLCCYAENLCEEQSIQMIDHRFNTAQRELTPSTFTAYDNFKTLFYDEIVSDDYDSKGFKVEENTINNAIQRPEGYCYTPHYQIPLRTFSNYVDTMYPIFFTIKDIDSVVDDDFGFCYEFYTMENNGVKLNQTLNIFDKNTQKRYLCTVIKARTSRKFRAKISDEKGNAVTLDTTTKRRYKLFYRDDSEIPEYATFVNDGSCRFYWRNIIQNGMVENSPIEAYPFTNGALYINKQINLFVKRQDPRNIGKLLVDRFPYDYKSKAFKTTEENNYYSDDEIIC